MAPNRVQTRFFISLCFLVAGGALVGLQLGCATSKRQAEGVGLTKSGIQRDRGFESDVSPKPGEERLSKVIAADLSGLDFEQDPSRGQLIREARAYVRYRSGGMGSAEKARYRAGCASRGSSSPFCASLEERDWKRSARAERRTHRKKASVGGAALQHAAFRGDLTPLMGATDGQIIGALKRVSDLARLALLEKAVNQRPGCLPAPLLSALGFKMEQGLPSPAIQERVLGYYDRAIRCAPSHPATARARYRLALIQVAQAEYAKAAENFAAVVDHPEAADFRSRAIYWRYFCAKRLGDRGTALAMRLRMQNEFPLSLHGLLMGSRTGPEALYPLKRQDAAVRFRSELRADVNARIRAAEAVQAVGGEQASLDLLEPLLGSLKEVEPEFQLYVAVLLRRSGDVIRKFQLLSALFRENPDLISRQSLEMLFPLRQFELIRAHEDKADPYLVIALMRQESAFNIRARSRVGAMGLMQVMPGTAQRVARISAHRLYEPRTNIRVGVNYMSSLLQRFDGEAELALAAYNAGPERVEEWVRRYPFANRLLFVDLIPFRETREYVASIARNYFWYSQLYGELGNDSGRAPASGRTSNAVPSARASTFGIFKLAP